jgi:hypothetical protein
VSTLLVAVDQAAVQGPGGGFVPALAHEGLGELERDRSVRRR